MTYDQMKKIEAAVADYEYQKEKISDECLVPGERPQFDAMCGLLRKAMCELGYNVLKIVRDGRRNSNGPSAVDCNCNSHERGITQDAEAKADAATD